MPRWRAGATQAFSDAFYLIMMGFYLPRCWFP
jgi:hypothetical protein